MMITIRGLTKRFARQQVLSGLDAGIATGRVTGLIGPNGTGKTTLLKILLGLTRPDAGTVTVGAQLLDGSAAYRAQIGYMPQVIHLPAHQSGRELLKLMSALRGPGTTVDTSLADAFGLGSELDRPVGVLSGGTRQKINAVLAFAFTPALLILDEPTAGLDPQSCGILKQRIVAECHRGNTVVMTSHVLPELEEVADDVLLMMNGVASYAGSVDNLRRMTDAPTLERAVMTWSAGNPILAAA
jgi:Cu-processing system ATP-binding protein